MDDLGICYDDDSFADIVAADPRYHAHAYAILRAAFNRAHVGKKDMHVSADDLMENFRTLVLDAFGPMSYTVLSELGVTCTEDLGEMMRNLLRAKRVLKDQEDTLDSFVGGYDFKTEFLDIFEP